jgi:hypothetical protein
VFIEEISSTTRISLRDLCAMPSPLRQVLAQKPPGSLKKFHPLTPSPSVTSVTSVRCLPLQQVLAQKPPRSLKKFHPPTPIPLRDLCDLCAMPSPLQQVLAQKPPRSLYKFHPPTPIPLRDLCDRTNALTHPPSAWSIRAGRIR